VKLITLNQSPFINATFLCCGKINLVSLKYFSNIDKLRSTIIFFCTGEIFVVVDSCRYGEVGKFLI